MKVHCLPAGRFSTVVARVFIAFGLASPLMQGAPLPENLVADGIPDAPAELRADVARYLEFRAAVFNGWHPLRREALISTRFADTAQLHLVQKPGGMRRQLTFLQEPVSAGTFRPGTGEFIVFSQDTGGGEFYQLYRYDVATGRVSLLTDGKARNTAARWSRSGKWLAYSSTRRNGKDTDIWILDPADPKTDRMLLQLEGGGWTAADWSADDSQLLVLEFISVNESRIHLVQVKTGQRQRLAPDGAEKVAYSGAQFGEGDRTVFTASDKGSEFRRLVRIDLGAKSQTPLTSSLGWDVEDFELSPDRKHIAFVSNEDGASVLHVMNARSGKETAMPRLPVGVISGLRWHDNGREIGFTFSTAKSSSDVYSIDMKRKTLDRWTESETGGLDPKAFVEPELARLKSFDGLAVSAFVYRPDPARHTGKRPVIVVIHGGPEGQTRPSFQARMNFYLNELGIAIVYPNVRGSTGYGKTFLTLDNGMKREDSVRDIGAVLDWVRQDENLDSTRIAVMGGSYGGYMVLASLVHYGNFLRAGVDVVGISSFVSFLRNTQDYRRDLRRAEYGDERDPAMRGFLERISPLNQVAKIRKPLFVVQGLNDPRVPRSESEQMVNAIRQGGGLVWYLLAKDEGHGFARKRNQDFQFLATILFLKEHLLR